ncbi:hypothetical protein GGX14DRAFT_297897, partial [Mycena pura]
WWDMYTTWPGLSQMALDYLSIPVVLHPNGSFCQGRHLLVFTRNRLSGDSIRKMLCFGGWTRRDLVRTEDI